MVSRLKIVLKNGGGSFFSNQSQAKRSTRVIVLVIQAFLRCLRVRNQIRHRRFKEVITGGHDVATIQPQVLEKLLDLALNVIRTSLGEDVVLIHAADQAGLITDH